MLLMDHSATRRLATENAQDMAKNVGAVLSSKLEDVRNEAGTVINRGSKRAQSASKQGLDAITEMADQARYVASNAVNSIAAYTKKKPVTALALAAASGVVLYAMIKALTPSRD
jgi:ElaB/YqjD/DUF883 family membrane-anchored ribosome-binding protein